MHYVLMLAASLFFCGCKTHSPQQRSAISVRVAFSEAWRTQTAATVLPEHFTVETRVVVARDGGVVSAVILKSSGNEQVDELVAQVLKSVTHVPPFPEGMQDAQKTFFIILAGKPEI